LSRRNTVKRTSWLAVALVMMLASVAVMAVGCGKEKEREKVAQAKDGEKGHDHSGWWCAEHGVPEAICGQCSAEVAAECKKKSDWCKEHDRPESQCFICHPELKEKFADQYRTKYGKEPPPMDDQPQEKDGDQNPRSSSQLRPRRFAIVESAWTPGGPPAILPRGHIIGANDA
jgi:hypothetical protein